MKRILFIYVFIGIASNIVLAQSTPLKQYYYWINQAELAICDSDFTAANQYYDNAFSCHKPLGKHLSTAFWMNITYAGDTTHLFYYASQLRLCGRNELAESYSTIINYDTNIYNRLLEIEKNTKPTFDSILKNKLEAILDKDQSYRHGNKTKTELNLNDAIIKDIYTLYDSYDTINDYTAGLHFATFNLKAPGMHYVQVNNHKLQELLKKEVLKGNIQADLYMDLEDLYSWGRALRKNYQTPKDPNGYGMCNYYLKRTGDYLFITYPENVKKVNKNRKKLGISETFEDLVKKVVWQYTTGKLYWTSVNIFTSGDDNDDNQYVMQQIKEIEEEHAANDIHRLYYLMPQKK